MTPEERASAAMKACALAHETAWEGGDIPTSEDDVTIIAQAIRAAVAESEAARERLLSVALTDYLAALMLSGIPGDISRDDVREDWTERAEAARTTGETT